MKSAPVELSLADTAPLVQFVAGLFGRPLDEASCEFLHSIDITADDPILASEDCARGLSTMQKALVDMGNAALEKTSVSYHRLFVGPHHLPCPPWGSFYLDGGRLFGPSSQKVAHQFAARGFAVPGSSNEPSDHIAYELAFLAVLMEDVLSQEAEGDNAQVALAAETALRFQCDAIDSWFPQFAADVQKADGADFYQGLVELTQGLLALSAQQLSSFGEERA